jgi:hypothetical protein
MRVEGFFVAAARVPRVRGETRHSVPRLQEQNSRFMMFEVTK